MFSTNVKQYLVWCQNYFPQFYGILQNCRYIKNQFQFLTDFVLFEAGERGLAVASRKSRPVAGGDGPECAVGGGGGPEVGALLLAKFSGVPGLVVFGW